MGRRRFAPLIALVLLGAAVLVARLFAVQVLEGEIWTAQADSLVRQGTIEPYTRGEIRDARGRVLARDVESYRIDADYRDFRRGNALGVVAHARSTLELRPVPLAEARETLVEWALALGRLSAADLEAFARGGPLACAGLALPATDAPRDEARAGRAVDLAFYATALLDLKSRERSRIKKRDDADRELAFFDRVAAERRTTRADVEATLVARCRNDLQFLADFAALWAQESARPGEPLAALLAELEGWRAEVEDGAASDLFEAAAGFPAGRLDAACLAEFLDLEWIRRCLRWDAPRLAAWTLRAREHWLAVRDGPALDFAVERAKRDADRLPAPELVLRELAPLFAAPDSDARTVEASASGAWRARRALLFSDLGAVLGVDVPRRLRAPPALPPFDPDFAAAVEAAPGDAGVLARVEFWRTDGAPPDPGLLEGAAAAWRERCATPARESLRRGFEALFVRLEDAFQAEARARLSALHAAAAEEGELDPRGRLPIAAGRLDRAEERMRYILKDRGSRPFVAVARPSYALVNLLTRYPHYLRGFEVRRVHMRVNPTRDASGRVLARLLVGRLAPPNVERLLSQSEIASRIRDLESRGGRDEEAETLLAELRASLDRPDEQVGSFGLESWFEAELAGRNGFHEESGLSERDSGARARGSVQKVDGLSLTTTLDVTLQEEAEHCLEHPEGDPDPSASDQAWLAKPTGALVLITPQGDVLVAASVPLLARPPDPLRARISDDVRERTLTKPDFQPPGSTFKAFVAPFALDRLGLDPRAERECSAAMNPGGHGPGYGGVHCHETSYGHGKVDLRRALTVSCNSYFAWLGEQHDVAALQALAHEFGFGEPTGVRAQGDGPRRGLQEDFVPGLFRGRMRSARSFREAGNGLSVVEATPMQVARATAGLATGTLPELRLASRIGDQDLPRRSRPLQLSPAALATVRSALLAVTNDPEGSAHAALSESQLGFTLAGKTGSADLTSVAVEERRVLKHTWFAGWFPAEDPVGVLVVFEHRTTRTSTHGAIWLARQFLKRPAVAEWIAQRTSSR